MTSSTTKTAQEQSIRVFLPTTLTSFPPGVMLLNHSTTPRDSATDIEKTSRKSAPEREQPNKSVVKRLYLFLAQEFLFAIFFFFKKTAIKKYSAPYFW